MTEDSVDANSAARTSSEDSDDRSSQDAAPAVRQSRLISRVLSPAVRLWLRSQLEQVEDLQIQIEAGDRQLLSGEIDRVFASAQRVIYQGLHFSRVSVAGADIQTNLKQVLRGKPFRLLTSFPVTGSVTLSEADLNASLASPLLATAVSEFLLTLLPADTTAQPQTEAARSVTLENAQVTLADGSLTLTATLVTPAKRSIAVQTGLVVKNGNLLKLEGFQYGNSLADLAPTGTVKKSLTFPLGSDVHLTELTIRSGELICQGKVVVLP